MRRYTLGSFEKMIELFDKQIFLNKSVINGALGYISLAKKIGKLGDEEKARFEKEYEEYMNSDEFK